MRRGLSRAGNRHHAGLGTTRSRTSRTCASMSERARSAWWVASTSIIPACSALEASIRLGDTKARRRNRWSPRTKPLYSAASRSFPVNASSEAWNSRLMG
jgi:hypothetical protein